MNPAKSAWRSQISAWRAEHIELGASEAMYLVGLAFFLMGLWIWLGLGVALASTGSVLIVTAVINDLALAARTAKAKNV